MCGEQTIDLSDELAESGALKINDAGFVEAHVEDVPAGCMVFLGVKYSPGLKGEDVESIQQRSCENWEFVKGTTVAGQEFKDSAHRVLAVTGLPVECTDDTDCGFVEQCIPGVCDLNTFTCVPGDPVPECCSSDDQCDDGDACTLDFCDAAGTERCFTEPNPDPVCLPVECTDDTDCGFVEQCIPGVCDLDTFTCIPGDPVPECCSSDDQCDDGDACTLDFCDVAGTERCFTEPDPDPVCLPEPVLCTECQELSTTFTLLCVAEGGSFEDCLSKAEPIFSGCALICEGTPEEKTDTCSSAVEFKNNVCLLSGGDFGVCRDEAEAFFFECSGEELPPVLCTECQELSTTFTLLCVAEGGSFEDCLSQGEQILSGCALICEGTPEEKTDTCSSAVEFKNHVCLLSGGDFGVCRDEAEAFFFECSGEELPPVLCTECQELSATFTLLCLDLGGSFEDCLSQGEQILSECALICEGTTEEKTDTCSTAADAKNQVCVDAGGEALACQEEADDFFAECSGEDP